MKLADKKFVLRHKKTGKYVASQKCSVQLGVVSERTKYSKNIVDAKLYETFNDAWSEVVDNHKLEVKEVRYHG